MAGEELCKIGEKLCKIGEELCKIGEELCLNDEELGCVPKDAKVLTPRIELSNKLDRNEYESRMLVVMISLPVMNLIAVYVVVMLLADKFSVKVLNGIGLEMVKLCSDSEEVARVGEWLACK